MALLTSRQNTFFLRHALTYLPRDYTPSDGSRMLLGYFTVAGLDLLDILDGPSTKVTSDDRHGLIDWIYRLQLPTGGFRGFTGTDLLDQADDEGLARVWDPANVPSTFFALMALLALGDDLVRVKRRECLEWLPGVQRVDDGSFGEVVGEGGRVEGGRDARPCCCAAGIRYVLRGEDERGIEGVRDIDVEGLIGYIRDSQSYEGGFGGGPGQESHSGLTYAAIGTLWFLGKLPVNPDPKAPLPDVDGISLEDCVKWMLDRQTTFLEDDEESPEAADNRENGAAVSQNWDDHSRRENPEPPVLDFSEEDFYFAGFSGRTNKIADTCYCFWNTGALAMLNRAHLVDVKALRRYLFEKTQHIVGGFGKGVGARPDIMHGYLGLACLSIYGETELQSLDPSFAISVRARERLRTVSWWKEEKFRASKIASNTAPYVWISGG